MVYIVINFVSTKKIIMAAKKIIEKIHESYKNHVLTEGERPKSVFLFCKSLKIKESVFYEHFSSFEQIESDYLASLFHRMYEDSKKDEMFNQYSVREKVLSLLFSHFQTLTDDRSYILAITKGQRDMKQKFFTWKSYRNEVLDVMQDVLSQADETDNIPDRLILTARYKDLLWFNVGFVFNYWLNDTSKGFENTDACIEKSVNLCLDLLQKNTLDHAFDFGKFLFQSIKN